MKHPYEDKTVETVEAEILREAKCGKFKDFTFEMLKMRLGETCMYETLQKALESLIQKGKIVQSDDRAIYNLSEQANIKEMAVMEDKILEAIVESEVTGITIEEIIEKTGIDKQEASYLLLFLEIERKVVVRYIHGDGFIIEVYCLTEEEYQDQIQVFLWKFFFSGHHEQKV
ncbi:MAG: hypothetical protein U9P70_03215 [Patescibacteria group bacterium]|nr:hypothetical protein [Patescibacteria group bacterium]